MKKILMVRHAKSSWNDVSLADIERPLNSRGKRDAPFMSNLSTLKYGKFDYLLASSSKRTQLTSRYFIDAHGIESGNISYKPDLYLCQDTVYLDKLKEMENSFSSCIVIGHNPGITSFVNRFSKSLIENIPTCGIYLLESDTNDWAELKESNIRFISFFYPKMYF